MLNLFALVRDPAARIQRFVLDANVQAELTAYIEEQEKLFNSAAAEIPFDGKYKPDAGEVLVIDSFDDIDGLAAAIAAPMGVPEVNPSPDLFDQVCSLFFGRVEANGSTTVLLQNFDRRRVLSTSGLSIFHSTNVFKKIEGVGLTVDWKLAAIMNGNVLKFNSFHNARQIFDLSNYYIEATDADIKTFVATDTVLIDESVLVDLADTWIRRKIALVQQSQILTKVPLIEIQAAAAGFGIFLKLTSVNGQDQLEFPETKAELKTLLRFLDEDYYESPLSKTHFITNSKRAAKP